MCVWLINILLVLSLGNRSFVILLCKLMLGIMGSENSEEGYLRV